MSLKVLFMGTPEFAVPILESINESKHKILEVYTQPPKKKNRGQKINISSVHEYAKKINLPVRFLESIEDEELEHIKNLKVNVVVVVAYGKILPTNLLNLKNILFINVHASLLPRWRGAAPIQRAIMNMDSETGISIMKIVSKLDAGPVMMRSKLKISTESNYQELCDQMSTLGAKLIIDSLDLIEKKEEKFISQNELEATYAKKIEKTESKINWKDKAKKIVAKINALYINPGCWFNLLGSRIKIIKAKEVVAEGEPGTILNNNFTIACSENAIQILELKKEGKKNMTTQEFLRGNKLKVGTNLDKNV